VAVGDWLVSQTTDLYATIKARVIAWVAGETGANTGLGDTGGAAIVGATAPIGIGTVAVAVGDWLVSAIEPLADKVTAFVAGAWDAVKGVGQDVYGYAIRVGGWAVKGAVAYGGTKAIGEAAVRYCEARAARPRPRASALPASS